MQIWAQTCAVAVWDEAKKAVTYPKSEKRTVHEEMIWNMGLHMKVQPMLIVHQRGM